MDTFIYGKILKYAQESQASNSKEVISRDKGMNKKVEGFLETKGIQVNLQTGCRSLGAGDRPGNIARPCL